MDQVNSTPNPVVSYAVGGGADPLNISMDFTSTTQLATPGEYSITLHSQDGIRTGTLESFSIDKNGFVIGAYSNGLNEVIGQLALANFTNPEGLERGDGGILWATSNSGEAQIGTANTGARGSINSGCLEMSNVDMSTEFTNMIIAQRAFQANSRAVKVMDEILEEMANLKR